VNEEDMAIKVSAEEMSDFLDIIFPQVSGEFKIERIDDTGVRMRLLVGERHLRPGGTVSGPAMFSLADVSAYVATMSLIGKEALAVTTNCSLDFMRKPAAGCDLIADAEVLKLGKTLSVTDIRIYSEGSSELVARASMTYAIPPKR
jgi:uncharacterized protein (TIGR00369 family)